MNEAKCTAAAAAACVAYTHCRVILWRKEMFDNHLAIGRPPKRAAGSLAAATDAQGCNDATLFFSNTHKKQWDEIMSRHTLTQRNVWKSLSYLGRLPDGACSGQPGHWLKMLQWHDIVFIKACTQKVRIFSNVHTKYQPLVIGIDGLIQRLDR